MSRYPALIAAAAALFAMSPARAQQDPSADYPNRPVKIIVSVPAGGNQRGISRHSRLLARADDRIAGEMMSLARQCRISRRPR